MNVWPICSFFVFCLCKTVQKGYLLRDPFPIRNTFPTPGTTRGGWGQQATSKLHSWWKSGDQQNQRLGYIKSLNLSLQKLVFSVCLSKGWGADGWMTVREGGPMDAVTSIGHDSLLFSFVLCIPKICNAAWWKPLFLMVVFNIVAIRTRTSITEAKKCARPLRIWVELK